MVLYNTNRELVRYLQEREKKNSKYNFINLLVSKI